MFYVKVDFLLFLAMLFSCLWIQIATNLFNEYYDFKRGLDTEDSVGIGGAIVRHGMKPETILQLALGSYAIALVLGVYICMSSSWWLAAIGLAGMLIGYLYTGGRCRLRIHRSGNCSPAFAWALYLSLFLSSFRQAELMNRAF